MRSSNEDHFKPLAVSPKAARQLLSCGHQKLYDLIGSGALESYVDQDGRARKILMASIETYIGRQLEAAKHDHKRKTPAVPPTEPKRMIEQAGSNDPTLAPDPRRRSEDTR
jgi:hypothetical protein